MGGMYKVISDSDFIFYCITGHFNWLNEVETIDK